MKFKTLLVLASLFLGIIFLSGISNAEQKTIIKEYSYQAGEQDSKVSSRIMAMTQIKRMILEEAGTYIAGTTVVKGLQLETDEINAVTAGIVSLKVIDESWNGKVFYMKAEATIDTDDIAKKLENMARNQNQIGELESAQQKIDELQVEVESLKAGMLAMHNKSQQSDQAGAASPQPAQDQPVQQDYAARYNAAVNQMSGLDMVQNSYVDINSGDYYKALDTLNNAIVLSPIVAPDAYIAMGIVYVNLNVPQEAIATLNKAVRLNPEIETRAVLTRALMYERSGDKNLALEEVHRAIRIDPREPWAYRLRARLYIQRGSRAMALADLHRARKLYEIRRLAFIKTKDRPATQGPSQVITITSSSLNTLEDKPAAGIRSRDEVRREQEKHYKERLERARAGNGRVVQEQQHPVRRQQDRQIRTAEIKHQRQQRLQQEKRRERQRLKQDERGRQRQKTDKKQRAQEKG
ncbi:MAG: hypothetical protein ACLQF0_14035 [Dissulfurispiraceae bacterium]